MRKIIEGIAITLVILFLCFVMGQLNRWAQRESFVNSKEFLVPTEIYRQPIIRLPFVSYKPPVPFKYLPVPAKEVDKTITITVPGEIPVEATLVIDYKGNIYTTTNFPENVQVKVVKWAPPIFQIAPHFGYSLTYLHGFYHCLSMDLIRLWNFHFGCEVGIQPTKIKLSEALIGLSVKYQLGTLDAMGLKTNIQVLLGWNFMNNKPYGGVGIKW